MKIIFSRKGFDSAAGRVPSPIIGGRPVSVPIPASRNSATSYTDLGLGEIVRRVTSGRMTGDELCHHDPMFVGGECVFGQTGAARSHLARQGVGPGDLFLFFGLFADEHTSERHHRVFGYLQVASACSVADHSERERMELQRLRHPHFIGEQSGNDTIYRGEGAAAQHAHPDLRLTRTGGPLSQWRVPSWLQRRELTYHRDPRRWATRGELSVVARGQEFVCDVGDDREPREWAARMIGLIRS